MSVAVIIPVRNMADTLERAVLSAAGADEIHVVDDASTDGVGDVMASLPPGVIYWRWPMKTRCHLAALRTVYHATACRQIIGMGADDFLKPGFLDAVRQHADAPVLFSDYAVVGPDENLISVVPQSVTQLTAMAPEEMRRRIKSPRIATETGIGSSLRRDVADWLWETNWVAMGPHADSVGYACAAAKFGCVLLPFVGAAYTWGRPSYGRDNTRTPEDISRWADRCREWLAAHCDDEATAEALLRKRCLA